MCSKAADEFAVDEGVEEDLLMRFQKDTKLSDSQCKKCTTNKAAIVLRENDTYCLPCLQVSVRHKFRSCLGKSKMMKSGEKVLVAFSGGQASVALLQLIKDGLNEAVQKRLRFLPHVIYIDEGALLQLDPSEQDRNLKTIASIIRSYDFPVYASSLEMVMAPAGYSLYAELSDMHEASIDRIRNKEYETRLQDLFHSVNSLTSKEDFLLKLRHQLLAQIAKELGCSKVFLGNSETRIAVRVLTDLTLGKGQHLAQTCGFADNRHVDVTFVRPLREILSKELSFYVNSLKLQTVLLPKLSTKVTKEQSIQRLTESFVLGLQQDFPATVSTIFRTGDKMGSAIPKYQETNSLMRNSEPSAEHTSCIMCFGSVDVMKDPLTKEKPQFSISEVEKCGKTSSENSCSECQCSTRTGDNCSLMKEDLMKFSCYSCCLILKEMTNVSSIPPCILNQVAYLKRREKMKSAISEFLLNPDNNDS